MFDNVNWPLTIGLLALWGLFLFLAPDAIVGIVAMGIAGYQVGSWIFLIASKS